MAHDAETFLGNAWQTIYSDELWYLIATGTGEIWLEARFQSDAPARTGYPDWKGTEFCIFSDPGGEAIYRIPYDDPAHLLASSRISFVPEAI